MSEQETSKELDKALKHLLNRSEPSPEPEAAPASEAQAPEVQEWYWGSRCVECGKQIPAGQMQHCLHGGYCNHHVPVALRAEVAPLREKLAQAERKGWNDAVEAIVNMVKGVPACPFDGPCSLTPTDPCPVCGDTGDDLNYVSHCRSPLNAIRALVRGEKC